jgi:hypothetical protein
MLAALTLHPGWSAGSAGEHRTLSRVTASRFPSCRAGAGTPADQQGWDTPWFTSQGC